jgi:hypothetical protein
MRIFSTPAVFLVKLACYATMACASVGAQAISPAVAAVGEVTLTIGRALIISSTGEAVAAQRGSKIQSGDRVETSDGGHVHIRFVDGALVSVRPTSRLVIEEYQYNPALPAQSTVRFRLDQGVTRAISGEAAHAARDRFRLNTPLVAIGVRGTDFVVRTQAGQTLAAVNQGSIVLAPFGDGCLPTTLGPCSSAASRYLSADMGRVFAEFRSQFAQLDIKPLPQLQTTNPQAVVVVSARMEAEPSVAVPREGVKQDSAATAVTSAVVQGALRKAISDDFSSSLTTPLVAVTPVVVVVPPVVVALPVVVTPPVAVIPPVVVVPPPTIELPSVPAQLAWGRWGPAGGNSHDFSVSLAAARTEGRQVTVGSDNYILYRIEPTAGASIANPAGPAFSFSLQQAYAQLATPNLVVPATVTVGALSIDFAARQFVTSLSINSVSTGAVQLAGSGYIRTDGIFVGTTDSQRIAGAIAVDTKSAGYFFEKFTNGGLLSGITLWGR